MVKRGLTIKVEGHPLFISEKKEIVLARVERNKKGISIIFLLLCLMLSTFAYADKFGIVPKAVLILPEHSLVKIKWIIEPSQKDQQPDLTTTDTIQFVLDYKNTPFISCSGKILMNPLTGYIIKFNKPFKQVIYLDNGALIFSDGETLAYPEIERSDKHIIPTASLKTFLKLPLKNSSIYSGDKNSLYGTGYNEVKRKYEIFLFNPKKKIFKRIAVTDEKIDALAGRGNKLYIATGRQIKKFSNGRFRVLYEHPREAILGLFYSEKNGSFL